MRSEVLKAWAFLGFVGVGAFAHADPPSFPAGTDLYFGIVPAAAQAGSGTASGFQAPAVDLEMVTVQGRAADLIGQAETASSGRVGQTDIAERPLLRPAEVLEAVPGLLITQHSGDGKANQYFTRGFNLDHGTDFAFSMDGIPLNEPSNAHGQGYTDLNFMIPELVQAVTYTKGPFDVEEGDFATAGSADILCPDRLTRNIAEITMGEFGYNRALGAYQLSLLGGNLIYAMEIVDYDGPWDTPEGFKKYNGFLRYSRGTADERWTISYASYEASWNATNQVPNDAVSQGVINAFGSMSPSDGGNRSREFLWGSWTAQWGSLKTDALVYAGVSHLDLWNDFNFYLPYQASGQQLDEGLAQDQYADPAATNGEQFEQRDDRTRCGGSVRAKFSGHLGRFPTLSEAGLDFRNDNIWVGLYNTDERVVYETDSLNHVVETSAAPYVWNSTRWTPWLRTVLGFREDLYAFKVANQTPAIQDGVNLEEAASAAGPDGTLAPLSAFDEGAGVGTSTTYQASMPEPKAAVIVRPQEGPTELYFDFGQGFHSNDARELSPGVDPLARVDSEELGARYYGGDAYETSVSVWRMDMASELTFDGDTALSSPNGASTRQGLEWSNTSRFRPFYVDLDAALSQARFLSTDTSDDPLHPGMWVPLAIERVGTLTLGVDKVKGWSVDARVRYFGGRALTPDDAVRSPATTLVSFQVSRHLWAGQRVSLEIFNVFDQAADDVCYYYAYAAAGVDGGQAHEAVMGHATEPRSIRVTWTDAL
jgi:hypothetical protein